MDLNKVMDNQLEDANRNVAFFTDEGRVMLAKVVHIYDADTVHCVVEKDGQLGKLNVRLSGIDTPEMRPSKSQGNRDQEKMAARIARNKLVELVTGVPVDPFLANINDLVDQHRELIHLECMGEDKYGRTLGILKLVDGSCVNDILVEEGYAGRYDGGTKQPFTSYFRYIHMVEG
ncbi:MAG: thermonuclease family protein [Gammaproteobacteria bacterium]|nr:thermonuclease family protein [Gammaproteobacteria bacterium]